MEESFIKIPRRMQGKATGNELAVYCYLAGLPSFYKTGAYPRRAKVCTETKLSHNTVDCALQGLVNKGFLERQRKQIDGKLKTVYSPKNGAE